MIHWIRKNFITILFPTLTIWAISADKLRGKRFKELKNQEEGNNNIS